MTEVNTDSYPKPPALPVQKSLLDNVGQYQQLQSNQLTIGKQQLDLMNSHFQIMNAELSNLADDPNATPELAVQRLSKIADTLGTPAPVRQQMLSEYANLKTPQEVNKQAQLSLMRGMDIQQKINKVYGVPGSINTGQEIQPTLTRTGQAPQSAGAPIQVQAPPTQPEYDAQGNPRFRGNRVDTPAPGAVIAPPAAPSAGLPVSRPAITPPGPINNPAILGPSGNLGGTVVGATADQPSFAERFSPPQPQGALAGTTPLFEEGKKQLAQDQSEASARMMRAKPALQALPLMQDKGFLSGPGTEQFTKAVAALKSFGLVNTANDNDPTAIRQEVTKKLAQYVAGSPVGQRSDAAQTLAEASNPNPKEHILPALIKLTKDAVALDRVQAAIPNAFQDKDLSKYGKFRSNFPQSIDERAFSLDLEPEEKSSVLVDSMAKQLKSSNVRQRNEAERFFKSLRIAKDQGFYQ